MFLQITDMFKLYILNLCFIWFGFRHKNHLFSLENVMFWLKIPSFVATNTAGQLKRPFFCRLKWGQTVSLPFIIFLNYKVGS